MRRCHTCMLTPCEHKICGLATAVHLTDSVISGSCLTGMYTIVAGHQLARCRGCCWLPAPIAGQAGKYYEHSLLCGIET